MIEELRNKIEFHILQAIREGWTITPEIWVGNQTKACCALGAGIRNARYIRQSEIENGVDTLYGLTEEQRYAFTSGFDGVERNLLHESALEYWALGVEMREKYAQSLKTAISITP